MPRIQTFVSNQVREEIESLVTERRQEGVTENDATVSSVTSMLIELGLRVYRIQREKKESGFKSDGVQTHAGQYIKSEIYV
ncbi:relaxosome protein TraM [Escherichia coli]|uniref:relaxosome protein TraM n=1 Tax=Escherichia coli TaxID=562 RepID=UPI0008FED95A